ncbi:phosphohydrolase [Morganella phage vB_Mm5]
MNSHVEKRNRWVDHMIDNNLTMVSVLKALNKTDAEYHTTQHMIGVATLVYVYFMKLYYGRIKPNNAIMQAALFHDYKYNVYLDNDRDKVSETIDHLIEDMSVLNAKIDNSVLKMIEYTEWPHREIAKRDLALAENIEILRNADLIYSTVFCEFDVVAGLFIEMHNNDSDYNADIVTKFIHRNIKFMNDQDFSSDKTMLFSQFKDMSIEYAMQVHNDMLANIDTTVEKIKLMREK